MSLSFGPRLRALLDEPLPAVLCTARRDGSVESVPIWYEYREGQIWLNGGPKRDWFKHLKRDPRATLLVLDPKNMFRWAQIQGRLAGTTFEGADDHIEHLSQRYFGRAYPGPKVERMIVRIEPERVTGGENRQPWDVTT
jgi:PPOX class probable F420-dependent enzyme